VRLEDGREVEITLDRIDDGLGKGRLGTLLTLRDAGSAMRLEQELEVSRRLAAVGRLTAGVGHEVKNPINAMVVHLELLRSKLNMAGDGREFLPGAMRHVEILAGEMERLDRVVQTLADFTRPMELHLVETDLQDVVENVVELTGVEMAEHRVEVRCALERVKVRADGELLRQALLNLMLNGMQAMEGGGVLRVSVRRQQDAAIIEVADDGMGIEPELMPRIFDLYFTTKAKGSGIGLAMTYRIVQMHGGALEVRSQVTEGAVFTMRLPLAVEARSGRALAGRAA
jgi:signal transduction histidine kinase